MPRTKSRPKSGKGGGSRPGNDKMAARGAKRKTTEVKKAVPAKKGKKEPDSVASTSGAQQNDDSEMKKMKFSGKVPVDENCKECATGYHVFSDSYFTLGVPMGTVQVYNAMLNQTNIGQNNNKYFILQLLKHDQKPEYVTWFRWGRVGKVAGTTLKRHGANLDEARTTFAKKFKEKTDNVWWWRHMFTKRQGKYDMLEMDYGQEEVKKMSPKKGNQIEVPSKLDKRVQDLIGMIFDVYEFEACVKELQFDVKKAPLGKLTTKQIKAGYETLKRIENCIKKKDFGKKLADACSAFYTQIPHDFGMKVPPLIKTKEELKQKTELLEALNDIQIAIKMIDEDQKTNVNIKDQHYESLGCEMNPLNKTDAEYKMVQKYVKNSHNRLTIEDVFGVEREEDTARFKKHLGNRMLLWHGSRLTNWCGILKKGLRIAPPEAPVSGYVFGKGVYFADMVSKSANYCAASKRQPYGFLLLCEVALGTTNDRTSGGDFTANNLPKGKSSTKGLGREVPDPKGDKTLDCGTVVPLGKIKKLPNPTRYLWHNEYIVYDVAQIKPRYLVKVKFDSRDVW